MEIKKLKIFELYARIKFILCIGIGTTFYGKKELKDDGSHKTTKWVIFLLLPIFPLGTYRVKTINNKVRNLVGFITEYEIIEKVAIDKKQVLLWYSTIYGAITGVSLKIP